MNLSSQQAKEISDIMGFSYSHHNTSKYEDDVNPAIYFYSGRAMYTFKIDTITGDISTPYSEQISKLRDLITLIKEKITSLGEVAPVDTNQKEYEDFSRRVEEVKVYLIKNNFI